MSYVRQFGPQVAFRDGSVNCRYCGIETVCTEEIRSVADSVTRAELASLYRRLGVIDHKIPLSRGGASDLTNLVFACFTCNCRKGSLTETEYLEKIGRANVNA